MTTQKRNKTAIQIQNACNPSGIAHAFIEACKEFRDSPADKGTDSLRADPALRLIAYQLSWLMGADMTLTEYARLTDLCRAEVATAEAATAEKESASC